MEFAARTTVDRIIVLLIRVTFGLDQPLWVLDMAKICLWRVMKIVGKALSDGHMSDIASRKTEAAAIENVLSRQLNYRRTI